MEEMVVRGEMRGVVVGRSPGQSPGSHTRDFSPSPAARKCGGALRRGLLLLRGGARKKRHFCCARWNISPTMKYGIEYRSIGV